MRRQTLKQMQHALSAINFINDGKGGITNAQKDITEQLLRALEWSCFAQGYAMTRDPNDPFSTKITEV